jgi:hypothetical protein
MDSVKAENGIEIGRVVRTRRKTIALVIEKDGSLTVRAPLRVSMKFIREFTGTHARWIRKNQEKVRARAPALERKFAAGETFLYLGEEYPLEFVSVQKARLILDGGFRMAESARREGKEVFERWYRARAKELLPERVREIAGRHGFQYQKVRIGSARTRWGSCSSKGTLSFSWRLILAPMEVVDYVVVHELCHTLVHNHSAKFWKEVERIMPEYKQYRSWLRKNGQNVML